MDISPQEVGPRDNTADCTAEARAEMPLAELPTIVRPDLLEVDHADDTAGEATEIEEIADEIEEAAKAEQDGDGGGASNVGEKLEKPKKKKKKKKKKKPKVPTRVLSLHVVDAEGISWRDLMSLVRRVGTCVARAQNIANTRMYAAYERRDYRFVPTLAWQTLRERLPCLPSSGIDALSSVLAGLFVKERGVIDRAERSLATFKAPQPLRFRARSVKIEGEAPAVWIEVPIRTSKLCDLAVEMAARAEAARAEAARDEKEEILQPPGCVRSRAPEGKILKIRLRCVANGGHAIATLRKLLRRESGWGPLDMMLHLQGGPTRKAKLMVKLAYSHPKAQPVVGQTAAAVLSLSNVMYVVAEDGHWWRRSDEGVKAKRLAFYQQRRRAMAGLRTSMGGSTGHGRKRLYRELGANRKREHLWMRAINWKLANELLAWCREHNVSRIIAPPWKDDVKNLPKEVQKFVLRWLRYDLYSKCGEVLARDGRVFEVLETAEPECRCVICEDAPKLEWTPDRVAHCPSCGFARDRDYVRCCNVLLANKIDVRAVAKRDEQQFREAKRLIDQAQDVGELVEDDGLESKPRRRRRASRKNGSRKNGKKAAASLTA